MPSHPLDHLMGDEKITEIMVNRFDQIFIEKNGKIYPSDVHFDNYQQLYNTIEKIVLDDGKSLTDSYYFDGALTGSYRYNIVMPPMNPTSPLLTMRRFSTQKFTLDKLVELKAISEKAKTFLQAVIIARQNIVVSGGTGSGKTTFLQALSGEIPNTERVVTVEDVPELYLHQDNWVQLLSVRTGEMQVSIKDCLVNSLRMRPDRIIVGECRRDETFEMLQAMNTGHDGSMTTVHSNTPSDCLVRLENLLHSSGFDVPLKYLRKQLAETIDFIVQLKRMPDGRRVISEIVEPTGVEGDVITRTTLFNLDGNDVLSPVGLVPKKIKHIEAKNRRKFPANFFQRN